ncbi:hypothetical protein ACN42_g7995 [Penicillium freii]|uniref:Uncharacterized protein n=1 Tax=Penicillium freii TaxID=48697 RepID=A0A117NMF0_PENFR|nr:hypothetical protein ACN42_g7995 [Penicillium freii]
MNDERSIIDGWVDINLGYVLLRDLYPVKLKKEMGKLETILIQNFEKQNKNIRNANSSVATLGRIVY